MEHKKNQRLRVTTDLGKTSANIPANQNRNHRLWAYLLQLSYSGIINLSDNNIGKIYFYFIPAYIGFE